MADDLKSFIGESIFIKFSDVNPIEGTYLGYNIEDDQFNPGTKKLVVAMSIDGKEKRFSSKSTRLARALLDIEVGQKISVERTGQLMKTNYTIKVLEDEDKKNEDKKKVKEKTEEVEEERETEEEIEIEDIPF